MGWPSLDDRFEAAYARGKDDECWLWRGNKSGNGYGRIGIGNRKYTSAHRLSYIRFCGEIPEGMHVCHTCDNPLCINPNHLFLGTHRDNMHDMANKGRNDHCPIGAHAKGERHWKANITTDTPARVGRRWTDADDRFLIFYGRCLNVALGGSPKGYAYIAEHDLFRSPHAAIERAKWLRRTKPDFVAELEREADAEPTMCKP